MPHPPDPREYKSALSRTEKTCNAYFNHLTALARDGRMGKLELDGQPRAVTPERLALLSLRNACVRGFYGGWAGEKEFWKESAERVKGSVLPGHAAALDKQMREGDRSHFLGDSKRSMEREPGRPKQHFRMRFRSTFQRFVAQMRYPHP